TTKLSSAGFGAKAAETLAVITGDPAQRGTADADARTVAASPINGDLAVAIRSGQARGTPAGLVGAAAATADSPRERAAVAEAGERWQRYESTVATLRAAPTPTAVKAIAEGPLNS